MSTTFDISVTGAGENLGKASELVYRDFEGGRVAFIALTSSLDDSALCWGYGCCKADF